MENGGNNWEENLKIEKSEKQIKARMQKKRSSM